MSGKMSSSAAFGYAASGSMNEQVASIYNQQMQNYYNSFGNATGWLGETIEKVRSEHDYFMRSRLWEFGKKLKNGEGTFVGRYEIGYLSGLDSQRDAVGLMRDVIMANPMMGELYKEGRVSGYAGDLSNLNFGIGRENRLFNRINNGYLDHTEEGTKHTQFLSTRNKMTSLSAKERHDAHRTWRATNVHIEQGYDPSISIIGDMEGKILTVEEGLKMLEELNKINEEKQ